MGRESLSAVVLCAGKGERMKSARAKVLHPLLGRPLCAWPVERAFEAGAGAVVAVVGHQAPAVEEALRRAFPGRDVRFALQAQQRGTGDAVASAQDALAGFDGGVLVLYGDVPLLTAETLEQLKQAWRTAQGPLALVSFRPKDPKGYGRLVREGGKVVRIVEEKVATAQERALGEVNAGIYLCDAAFLFEVVGTLDANNAQGEVLLTDIVARAAALGEVAVVEASVEEVAGVNDRAQLADAAKVLQDRINRAHMRAGVTFLDPGTTWVDAGATLAPDVVLGPQVTVGEGCVLGEGTTVGQGSVLTRARLGRRVEVKPYSVLEDATVADDCHVGPFARLRPGTELAEGVHVGNFVETKKAKLGKGTKASHLTYLGDAEIGQGCNIGAGTITCNYDGVNKHVTRLGDGVFIGSDSQLVAPVSVGDRAFVGAGSTITQDVPADALALSRTRQVTKAGWAEQRKKVLGVK